MYAIPAMSRRTVEEKNFYYERAIKFVAHVLINLLARRGLWGSGVCWNKGLIYEFDVILLESDDFWCKCKKIKIFVFKILKNVWNNLNLSPSHLIISRPITSKHPPKRQCSSNYAWHILPTISLIFSSSTWENTEASSIIWSGKNCIIIYGFIFA